MKIFSVVALLSSIALVAAIPTDGLAPADGPDKSKVYIESITYGGTGCPQGTVDNIISDDRNTFTLAFEAYVASSGPDVPMAENRKSCQLNFNLRYPPGWSFSLGTVDYRGYVEIPAGVGASTTTTYYFAGSQQQGMFSKRWIGPVREDYQVRDTLALSAMVWSTCSAPTTLSIKNLIAITGNTKLPAQMSSGAGRVTQTCGLVWKTC